MVFLSWVGLLLHNNFFLFQYEKGTATAYISRNQALRKLQLSLKDFRFVLVLNLLKYYIQLC